MLLNLEVVVGIANWCLRPVEVLAISRCRRLDDAYIGVNEDQNRFD